MITDIFSGKPARAIVNRLISEIGPINVGTPEFPLTSAEVTSLRNKAETLGSGNFSPFCCGQNGEDYGKFPAAELPKLLAAEM